MEYHIIKKGDKSYPARLRERLEETAPDNLYYHGALGLLDQFTMAVIAADSIPALAMMAANQLLFTIREYELNFIGSWHSVMETEIFRLGLFRKNMNVTLFSARGLAQETFKSYLRTRFYPPLHEFPEEDEYWRRARDGELLMLSVCDPEERKMTRRNIMTRNWIACSLGDVVFVPFAEKGTKTFTIAKRVVKAGLPVFTSDDQTNETLHELGIRGLTRKNVGKFLEELGASKADMQKYKPKPIVISVPEPEPVPEKPVAAMVQTEWDL